MSERVDSLDPDEGGSRDAIHEEWRQEIARRLQEIHSGKAEGIPFDELMAKLREEYP